MENYEKVEEEMHEFKKYLKMTMDLLCDSYKWKKLAEHTENQTYITKYKAISNTLYELFMKERDNIGNLFKEN